MDPTGLAIFVLVAVVAGVILLRQRRIVRTYTSAQREILERQKESILVQLESIQFQRESTRLLGVIAKTLEHKN